MVAVQAAMRLTKKPGLDVKAEEDEDEEEEEDEVGPVSCSLVAGSSSWRIREYTPPKMRSRFTVAPVPTTNVRTPPLRHMSTAVDRKFSFPVGVPQS
jgi:hypothetical protein